MHGTNLTNIQAFLLGFKLSTLSGTVVAHVQGVNTALGAEVIRGLDAISTLHSIDPPPSIGHLGSQVCCPGPSMLEQLQQPLVVV